MHHIRHDRCNRGAQHALPTARRRIASGPTPTARAADARTTIKATAAGHGLLPRLPKRAAALGEDAARPCPARRTAAGERRAEHHDEKLGTVVNPWVEADDDQLAHNLGLALNDELEEGNARLLKRRRRSCEMKCGAQARGPDSHGEFSTKRAVFGFSEA